MYVAQLELAKCIANRLERLSADSYWAHKASGIRGALLRGLLSFEAKENPSREEILYLEGLIQRAYEVLIKAAKSI